MGVPGPQGEGEIRGVEPHSQSMQLQIAAAAWRIQTSDSAFCQTSLNVVVVVCISDEVSGVVVQEHERLHQQLMTAHQSKESERSRLIASLTEGLLLTSLVACCFYCILLLLGLQINHS